MGYVQLVETIGLRDLRRHASDVIRHVEDGRTLTVTVTRRPTARLVLLPGPR